MEQIPADLPPRWFLGVIRELSIDTVTGMVKVTAESGEITYIQPAQAIKFAEWAMACKEQLAQAQDRLDAEVQEARWRLGQKTSFTVSITEDLIYRFYLGKCRVAGAEGCGPGCREDAALCHDLWDATGAHLQRWLCARE